MHLQIKDLYETFVEAVCVIGVMEHFMMTLNLIMAPFVSIESLHCFGRKSGPK